MIIPPLAKQDAGSGDIVVQPKAAAKTNDSGVTPAAETQKVNVVKGKGDSGKQNDTGPDKVIPIKVITSSVIKSPAALPGMAAERITAVSGEMEMAVKKKESPRMAAGTQKAGVSRRHIVQAGENLRSIAQKYYNDSNRWKEIYQANRDKVISGQVAPGQEITIP